MIDDKQTGINFNQTMHDINNFNKINEANLKSNDFANTANDKKNNMLNSGDKTIEMYLISINKVKPIIKPEKTLLLLKIKTFMKKTLIYPLFSRMNSLIELLCSSEYM